MTKRIFRSICLVALAVLLASLVLILGVLYTYFTQVQQNQLKTQTLLAAQAVSHEGYAYFDGLETKDCRITWIAADGTVLYDNQTDSDAMENHLEREEIREALAAGYGESARYSATLMERYLYIAQRLPDGTVLRLSTQQTTVLNLVLGMAQPIALVVAVAVVLSLILASRLSRRIVKPLNELNLDDPLANEGYDELAPLLRRIDGQQRQLRQQSDRLRRQQNEFDAVVGSMSEGLVLLNSQGQILSMNQAAARLFDAQWFSKGDDILTVNRSPEVRETVEKALSGTGAERILRLHDSDYQMDATPVFADGGVSGVVLLLFDVTEKLKSEALRREFTANVSHELKTPLQSISGYAELLSNGMVKSEDMGRFSEKIYGEAQRLIRLVEDIIRLSRLDEGAADMRREPVDLYGVASEVLRELTPAAELADVKLNLTGDSAVISGVPQLISGIVFNLCDNAVKYNRSGGRVDVSVTQEPDTAVLTVRDTGIGIPQEHQSRIFERFYRVDKSHSKAVGGTGLGLSIVNHAALIHGAKIGLQSVVGEGTTITVRFPKPDQA